MQRTLFLFGSLVTLWPGIIDGPRVVTHRDFLPLRTVPIVNAELKRPKLTPVRPAPVGLGVWYPVRMAIGPHHRQARNRRRVGRPVKSGAASTDSKRPTMVVFAHDEREPEALPEDASAEP